jgi:hypothetical protein
MEESQAELEQAVPTCWVRELAAFKPFGELWLSDKGGVPTSPHTHTSPQHASHTHTQSSSKTLTSKEDGKYLLFQSQVEDAAAEEEFWVAGTRVVHSVGHNCIKVLSHSDAVLQVAWCCFTPGTVGGGGVGATGDTATSYTKGAGIPPEKEGKNGERTQVERALYLCVLMKRELVIYSAEGDTYVVALPFAALKMWNFDGILLLQSQPLPKHADRGYPRLFSLSDPLEEPRPLGLECHVGSNMGEEGGARGGCSVTLASQDLEIDFVSCASVGSERTGGGACCEREVEAFIVTYTHCGCERRLWKVRRMPKPSAGACDSVSASAASASFSSLPATAAARLGVSHTSSAHVKASAHTPTYASHTSSRGGCGGALHDQGDATAYVYSDTAGYVACGSIGLGNN